MKILQKTVSKLTKGIENLISPITLKLVKIALQIKLQVKILKQANK